MTAAAPTALSPRLVAVLAAQCRAITVHMSNALLRSARSGVISSARDFSSVLLLGDARPLAIDEGLPVHAGGAHLAVEAVLGAFDDIEEGDCFLNNSPFMGNTHHADFTLCAPVFVEGELLFWVVSRAHQADVGAPVPSTYLPFAATVQEEGIHFPCVRVQRGRRELADVLRILTERVRVPDLCYADYLAQAGALRVAERRLHELCGRHGVGTIKAFVDEWLAYGDRMMAAAIGRLPAAEWRAETCHDPVPFAPDGIPVRATLTIDPAAGRITVDLRDNVDNVDGGLNLTPATTLAAVYGGILNNVGPEVPRNAGSLSRIHVLMREGAAVGIPRRGVGTSVATTNLCDRLFNLVQSVFARAGAPHGIAEGSCGGPPSFGVISGRDARTGSYYVNQTIIGFGGGPALHGHDGWLTYNKAVTGGVLRIDSVEINEQRFPIVYDAIELVPDTAGAGQWRGAPSVRTEFGPRFDELQVAYYGDAREHPPQGVLGGGPGGPSSARKRRADGAYEQLPSMGIERLEPGERIESVWSGGGGYGDPLLRDPERVRDDVAEGLETVAHAREAYGVVLTETGAVDADATAEERGVKAAVWHGALDVRVEDVAEPGEPGPGLVVVEVARAAICASDLAEYRDGPHVIPVERPHPLTGRTAPLTLGHEYSGRVAAVGDGVEGLAPGDRVCGDSCLRCNRCYWCLRGEYNICAVGASVGLHADGAFARFLEVPAYTLVRVPDPVGDDAAALVEPLAVGMHAVLKGGVRPGDTAVVVGCGMIGAAVLLTALAAGAGAVYAIEAEERRRGLALELGAAEALDPRLPRLPRELRARTDGIGADVVFDCTGRADVLPVSVELARRGGRVVVVGIPHGPSELDSSRLVYFERELVGALGYCFDHRRVLALLGSGRLDVSRLTGDPIGLSGLVSDGFGRMLSDPAAPLRILVEPRR